MALFLLVFTYSRTGLVLLLVAVFLTSLVVGWARIRQVWVWFLTPFKSSLLLRSERIGKIALRLSILSILLVLAAVSLYALDQNTYFSRIWRSRKTNLVEYVIDIYAGPRLAYALSGLEVFNQYPWTGVGLGASGLYMISNYPDWSKTMVPEIAAQLAPTNPTIPNIKNLYVRLLAETGIFGLVAFIILLLQILAMILVLRRDPNPEARFLVAAGLFTWIVIVLYNLTQDSLAMPNTWINLAMLSGILGVSWKTKLKTCA